MASFAIVVHHLRREALQTADEAIGWLTAKGHEVRLPRADAEAAGRPDLGWEPEKLAGGLNLAVSLGGDGTMLRTVELVAEESVPVLGVNIGQLGYLTELEPAQLRPALKRFLAGEYGIEERMRLAVEVAAPSGSVAPGMYGALNEAAAEKPSAGHTIRVAVSINGEFFTTYAADGLIVATPTGSTAYAFSVRGPIVSPRHLALIMTPVSPHMLFDRSLVLDPDETIRLEIIDDRSAMLTIDGRELGMLGRGDAITCTCAPQPARLVSFEPRHFHRLIKAKFGLADR